MSNIIMWRGWIPNLIRPVFAFFIAALAAGIIMSAMTVLFTGEFILVDSVYNDGKPILNFLNDSWVVSLFTAFFAAIPAMASVLIIRYLRWPRGWSEIVFGALIPSIILTLLSGGGIWLEQSGDMVWFMLLLTVSGAVAGLTYWLVVGRPEREVASKHPDC